MSTAAWQAEGADAGRGALRVGILAYPGCFASEVFGVPDLLTMAGHVAGPDASPGYQVTVLSPRRRVTASGRASLDVRPVREVDVLVVPGFELSPDTDLDARLARLAPEIAAIRAQAAVPGVDGTYGVKHGAYYEPANAALPEEQAWSTPAYLRFAPTYLAQVRQRFGFDFALLHDVHHRLTPLEAAQFGRRVEELDLFWMEDPTPADNPESFRPIRAHTTTPVATGEVLSSIWDVRTLITEQLIDYVRLAVTHAGGITHLRRIFNLAELYQVRSGSHGPSDISPIGQAAAAQLDLTIPNFGIQEYMGYPDLVGEVFHGGPTYADGSLHVPDTPGLGVDYDEAAAAKFEYTPKYLPVARRLDGSVHDW